MENLDDEMAIHTMDEMNFGIRYAFLHGCVLVIGH
jgi:hypothetical protein